MTGANGTNAGLDEGAVYFGRHDQPGITGLGVITDSVIEGGLEDNLHFSSNTGTAVLSILDNVIGLTSADDGNDALLIQPYGTGASVRADVERNTFLGSRGDLVQVVPQAGASAAIDLRGNTMHNTHPNVVSGGGGITISGAGPLDYQILDNEISGAAGTAIVTGGSLGAPGGPTSPTSIAVARGRIVGNTIGVLGMPGSGSSQGGGIHLGATGAATHIAYVAGNEISNVHGIGITAQVGDACPYGCPAVIGHGEYTIANNTISEPGDGAGNAIMLNHGTTSVDAMTSCLELSGNVLGGWVNGVDQIRLRQRQATTVRLRGYAGAPHDLSAVAAHARAANGDATASAATAPTGGGFTGTAGGMSCQIPPELT